MDRASSDLAEDHSKVVETLTESFTGFGKNIKQLNSDHAPALIDYTVIVSSIYEVTDGQCT
jgi:hypothetical protein